MSSSSSGCGFITSLFFETKRTKKLGKRWQLSLKWLKKINADINENDTQRSVKSAIPENI